MKQLRTLILHQPAEGADLRVAVAGGWRRAALTDPTTKAWLDGNGVQESDLT